MSYTDYTLIVYTYLYISSRVREGEGGENVYIDVYILRENIEEESSIERFLDSVLPLMDYNVLFGFPPSSKHITALDKVRLH